MIVLKNINKVFETEELQTHALRNISLVVDQGDFISISGPSGCGKSTLLSIMGLIERATSGVYSIGVTM